MTTDTTRKIHRDTRLRDVPLDKMRVNPQAQRELVQSWVDHLHAHFDLDKMQPPHVNERDGHFWIMDGQHSVEALKLWLGDWTGQTLQCWTYTGLTVEQEAEMFLSLNNKRTVTGMPRYRAAVQAGRAAESEVDRIVRSAGLLVGDNAGNIKAVGTLMRIYHRSGPAVLGRTVRIAHTAYGTDGLESSILDGLGLLCQRFNGEIDDATAVAKLAAVRQGATGLLQQAHRLNLSFGGRRADGVAAAAVEVLNAGRGGKRIPSWWKS